MRNTLHPNRRTVSTGVGLDNLRERLRLLYGEGGRLETLVDGDTYVALLTVPLSQKRAVVSGSASPVLAQAVADDTAPVPRVVAASS